MKWILPLLVLLLAHCDYVETTKETGHKGKARINPYLAAERFLEDYGFEVRREPGWPKLDYELGMAIMPASVLTADGYVNALEQWIERGGHAVVLLEYGESYRNDWADTGPGFNLLLEEEENAFDMWMERLGCSIGEREAVSGSKSAKAAESVRVQGEDFEVWMESRSTITTPEGDHEVVASLELGRGVLTLVSDARPFRNRYIGDYDHAALLLRLMEMSRYGDGVAFVRNASLSFWAMLWSSAWPALIALIALIAAWLWKNLPRFGPIDTQQDAGSLRAYDHHLEALGDFHWRLDRGEGLLRPLRESLLERTHALALASGRRDADVFELMSERSGISRERAERAMTFERARDSASFTRLVADLQSIHTSIP